MTRIVLSINHSETALASNNAIKSVGKRQTVSAQPQPEAAIVFLQIAVEVSDSIGENLSSYLDVRLPQSWTETFADNYRLLAA